MRSLIHLILVVCGLMRSYSAKARQWSYSADLGYISSSFDSSEKTESAFFLHGVQLNFDSSFASISIPIIYQNNKELGMGDTVVQFGREFMQSQSKDSFFLGIIQVGFKAPTGSEKSGLSTGEWDFSAGLSLQIETWRNWSLGTSATYWYIGNPVNQDLGNQIFYNFEVGRYLGQRSSIISAFLNVNHIMSEEDDPVLLGISFLHNLKPNNLFSSGLSFGLNSSAPDIIFSLGRTFPL